MTHNDWNPSLYLKFNKERTQPSIDLVSKIQYDHPKRILDIGCGPGNSTQVLVSRWPDAEITGLDNSPAMIEKASHDYPNQKWILKDAGAESIDGKFDILFSNATIQWIPDHKSLLLKFKNLLNKEGLLAIQIPMFWDMPLGKSIIKVSKFDEWKSLTETVTTLFTIHNSSFYYDCLSGLFTTIEIWETNYYHIMDSHQSIIEMIRSTGLKPYLEKLDNEFDRNEFEKLVLKETEREYPLQKDGKILFPFKRLFFIAR